MELKRDAVTTRLAAHRHLEEPNRTRLKWSKKVQASSGIAGSGGGNTKGNKRGELKGNL